jgi:hypothetical protein
VRVGVWLKKKEQDVILLFFLDFFQLSLKVSIEMASNAPRILTLKFESNDTESKVVFELGLKSVERQIPLGHGVIRAAVILDDKGQISDAELVTQKL